LTKPFAKPARHEVPAVLPPNPPDILYVAHRVPYPPDKGDRIRTFHLLRSLAQHAAVHLACLADEPVAAGVTEALHRYCARVAVVRLPGWSRWLRALGSLARGRTITEGAFHSRALHALLGDWAAATPFRAALVSSSGMVPYLQTQELRGVPAVIDLIDVDSQKWFDYHRASRWPRSWLYHTEGRRLRRQEQALPGWARAVTLVSEAEAELYRGFCAPGAVHAITNGVDTAYFQPPARPVPEDGCVFVGALDYRPNVDAASWFCREVWPEVHHRRPGAQLRLVGRRPAPAVRRLAELPGVEVVGTVPDVRPHLAGAAVAVVPLRIARGLQNKVLEALAMGKAVVASPPALVALRTQPGIHLLAASSPAEWTEAVLRLLDDEALRRRVGTAGRRYVEQHHDWEHCLEPFRHLLGLAPANGTNGAAGHS
jgi:sugar transferase (PEP-CTERM/EpsH1 system associated)